MAKMGRKIKRVDGNLFMENYLKWVDREITMETFAKNVGWSYPTLRTRIYTLWTEGKLDCFLNEGETIEMKTKFGDGK